MNDHEQGPQPDADSERTAADKALEKRLSEPLLHGHKGLDKAQVAISAFLIFLVGGAAFSNAISIPFHSDGTLSVAEAPYLHRIATISDGWDAYALRPMAAFAIALNWTLGFGHASAMHLGSVFIHLCNGVLVFLLCRRFLPKGTPEAVAMCGGMLFIAHPALTTSVNYLAYRGVLVGAFFMLLSLVLYLRATRESPVRLKFTSYVLSLVCFALAWASDLNAWTLPVLLLAVAHTASSNRGDSAEFKFQAPYWILLIAMLVAHFANVEQINIRSFGAHFIHYLAPTFYPTSLSILHPPFAPGGGVPILWMGLVIGAAVLLRFLPLLGLALLWYLLALVAPSVFISDSSLFEPRIYLAWAGIAFIPPWLIARSPGQALRAVLGIVVAALVIGFAGLSYARNIVWKSEVALWTNAAEICTDCFRPLERLGKIYVEQGRKSSEFAASAAQRNDENEMAVQQDAAKAKFEQAESMYKAAIQYDEAQSDTWLALANVQRLLGNTGDMRKALEHVIEIDPTNFPATLQLARMAEFESRASNSSKGVRHTLDLFRRADRIGPLPADALFQYGMFLSRLGIVGVGRTLLERSVAISPTRPARDALERATQAVDRIQNVRNQISMLATEDDLLITFVVARQLFLQGNYLQSSYMIEATLRVVPQNAELWLLLGLNKAKIHAMDSFLAEWPQAPEGDWEDTGWRELARKCASNSAWDAALKVLEHEAGENEGATLPLMAMAEIAGHLGAAQLVVSFLQQATEDYPNNPEPWIALAENVIASDQKGDAKRFIRQAASRGANEDLLADLNRRAGVDPSQTLKPIRSVIR